MLSASTVIAATARAAARAIRPAGAVPGCHRRGTHAELPASGHARQPSTLESSMPTNSSSTISLTIHELSDIQSPTSQPPWMRLRERGYGAWSFLLSLNRFHGHTPSISTSREKLSRIRIRTMIPSTVTLSNV
jgi:hypothetical protein